MWRIVIWMGKSGMGFGPLGIAIGVLSILAIGFLAGRTSNRWA
jgi:hypothetical protein